MIDIKTIIAQMLATFTNLFASNYPAVESAVTGYLSDAESRLTTLATYRISGDISDRFLVDRLAEEKDILLSELLSFEVIAKGVAEDAISQAQQILINTINAVLQKTS